MLDVIHLIVTVLSDRPSFEWECNVTGWPIWFPLLKLTFSSCFRVVVAQQCHGVMLSGGLAKGWWVVLGMVTEGGDWVVLTSHFYGSDKGSWMLLYAGCVNFTVDWQFWKLFGICIAPRPLLSWKKTGHFCFDNMGPLNQVKMILNSYWILNELTLIFLYWT